MFVRRPDDSTRQPSNLPTFQPSNRPITPSPSAPPRLRASAFFFLLALALIALKIYGDRFDAPFVAHFDGRTVSGITTRLDANFGDELILLGADFPHTLDSASGSGLTVKLYWRAAHPLAKNYSSAVHLLDAQGHLVAQSDHLHPAQLPTTRWDVDAYVEDIHTLDLSHLAPGIYSLVVRAYDAETGTRLLVKTAANPAAEDGFRLGSVEKN